MTDFHDFIESVKDNTSIEDVIENSGPEFDLNRRQGGWYVKGRTHDSLTVYVRQQYYVWFSRNEKGDVFEWLKNRHGWEFMRCLEYLADRAGMQVPKASERDQSIYAETRHREDVFGTAASVMHDWLLHDADALGYARQRGWTDETINNASLGFSGRDREEATAAMKKAFLDAGVDPYSPAAVAVIGYGGDVSGWCQRNGVEPQGRWLEWGFIPGLLGRKRIVYPHFERGRVVYLSSRNVFGDDVNKDGKEVKSFNPPASLAGKRSYFINHAWYGNATECVIVEGQADAITLGQWGIPAIALTGLFVEKSKLFEKHSTLYIGIDHDKEGQAIINNMDEKSVGTIYGVTSRILNWAGDLKYKTYFNNDLKEVDVKDANDFCRSMTGAGLENEDQIKHVRQLMKKCPAFWEMAIEWYRGLHGAEKERAQDNILRVIAEIPPLVYEMNKGNIAKGIGITIGQLKEALRSYQKERESKNKPVHEEPIIGGLIGGHLIELLYDHDTGEREFAVRTPDGEIDQREYIDIDGIRYIPIEPKTLMTRKAVHLPSKLAKLRPLKEIVGIVREFIHQYLDVSDNYERLASYYVLMSWVYDSFQNVPYLRALGDFGTGKTRFIQTIGVLCYRPLIAGGATSASAIYRTLDLFGGTLVLDEADYSQSDETATIIKVLNTGNDRSTPLMLTGGNNTTGFDVEVFDVFGPKVIATRKNFGDMATESRCLTYEMGVSMPRDEIPETLPMEFWTRALEIRNLLLAYRMKNWQPDIEVDRSLVDKNIERRLSQVGLALMTIAREDDDAVKDIKDMLNEFNRNLILERGMSTEAKVVEAIVEIVNGQKQLDGSWDLSYKHICEVTNRIIDEENMNEEGQSNKKLTPKGLGHYIRKKLQLTGQRGTNGAYVLVYDENKIGRLKMKFGIGDSR